MAKLKHLIFSGELKTSLLEALAKANKIQASMSYEPDFDALILRFTPDIETIVHYIDNHVGLLYRSLDKEIVGMQIEDFVHSFLPKHSSVQKVWRLSESDSRIENVGDLILEFQRKTPQVAFEIFKATEDLLENEGIELGKVLG